MPAATTHPTQTLSGSTEREQVLGRVAMLKREISAMLVQPLPKDLEHQLHRASLYLEDAEVFVRPDSRLRVDAAIYGADIALTVAARYLAHVRAILRVQTVTRSTGQ